MFKTLNASEIEDVISGNIIGRLGCHADGKTYVVPISYAYDGKYIYAHTLEGLKISMMRKNPEVCFQIDEMENMANWRSVVTWGTFEELTDAKERNNALDKLVARNSPGISSETIKLSPAWPFPTKDYSHIEGIVFSIRLAEKTGRSESADRKEYIK
jgi:nitroimidazol reductase NimA-like FMN-containing flavoprotein (pyridoxamine 5'-phosphate oxidase superfamily)